MVEHLTTSRTFGLAEALSDLVADAGSTSREVRLIGTDPSRVLKGLERLERHARASVWSTHPMPQYDPEDRSFDLEERSRRRGIDVQRITTRRAVALNPLLPSLVPNVRVGPAWIRCILVDRRFAVVEGPRSSSGDPSAWLVTEGAALAMALQLWDATLQESSPVVVDARTPRANARQLDVARRMCLGHTDGAIGRALGVSTRTVERDVRAIMQLTGDRSRGAAILSILGRGRHSSATQPA